MQSLDAYLRRVALAYEDMPMRPVYPEAAFRARRHYAALKSELWQQFKLLTAFVRVEFVSFDPYGGSREMFESVSRGALSVYTEAQLPAGHPFAERAPNGELYNSIFRAVHDGLAHYPERNSFGRRGEFRAFLAHARLLSSVALPALFTETVGQNAYYHFGPNPGSFAPQKIGLLPLALMSEYQRVTLEDTRV